MDDKSLYKEINSSLRFLRVVVASLSVLCLLLTGASCYFAIRIQAHQTSISVLHGSNAELIESNTRLTNSNVRLTDEVETLKEWRMKQDKCSEVPKSDDTVKSETLNNVIATSLQKREVLSGQGHSLTELLSALPGLRGPPGPPGKDGADGKDGRDVTALQLQSLRGPPGPAGKDGADGRDAVNFYAVDRHINTTVKLLADREMARVRLAANELSQVAGAVYTRWGRTVCPSTSDLVMKGIAAGTQYNIQGGAAEYICLPDDPDLTSTSPRFYSKVSGVEYQDGVFMKGSMVNQNAPCAICQTKIRSVQKMFPAKSRCPDGTWTVEYTGFLMSASTAWDYVHRTQYVCVDAFPEAILGGAHDTQGALWYHVVADCTTGEGALGACPPYTSNSALICVVCSK